MLTTSWIADRIMGGWSNRFRYIRCVFNIVALEKAALGRNEGSKMIVPMLLIRENRPPVLAGGVKDKGFREEFGNSFNYVFAVF